MRQAGFEPATRCLEGTVEPSRSVACYRSMSRRAAQMTAGCGPTSPEDCDCWLPVWLPNDTGLLALRGGLFLISLRGGDGAGCLGDCRAVNGDRRR